MRAEAFQKDLILFRIILRKASAYENHTTVQYYSAPRHGRGRGEQNGVAIADGQKTTLVEREIVC
jgi:hypothetical protein